MPLSPAQIALLNEPYTGNGTPPVGLSPAQIALLNEPDKPSMLANVGNNLLQAIPGADLVQNEAATGHLLAPGINGVAQAAGDIGQGAGLVGTGGVLGALKALGIGAALNTMHVPQALDKAGTGIQNLSDKMLATNLPSKVLGVNGLGDILDAASRIPGVLDYTAANTLPYALGGKLAETEPTPAIPPDLINTMIRDNGGRVTPAMLPGNSIAKNAGRLVEMGSRLGPIIKNSQNNLEAQNASALSGAVKGALGENPTTIPPDKYAGTLSAALTQYLQSRSDRFGAAEKAVTQLPVPDNIGQVAADALRQRISGTPGIPTMKNGAGENRIDPNAFNGNEPVTPDAAFAAQMAADRVVHAKNIQDLINQRKNIEPYLQKLFKGQNLSPAVASGIAADLRNTLNDYIAGKFTMNPDMWEKNPAGTWQMKSTPRTVDVAGGPINPGQMELGTGAPIGIGAPSTPKIGSGNPDQQALINQALSEHSQNPEGLAQFIENNRGNISPEVERDLHNIRAAEMWKKANLEHSQTQDIVKNLVKPPQAGIKSGLVEPNELYNKLFGDDRSGAPVSRLKPYLNKDQWDAVQNSILNHLVSGSSSDGMLDADKFSKNINQDMAPLLKHLDPQYSDVLPKLSEGMKRASLKNIPLTDEAKQRIKKGESAGYSNKISPFALFRLMGHPLGGLALEAAATPLYYGVSPKVMQATDALKALNLLKSTAAQRILGGAAVQAAQGNVANQFQKQ